MDTPSTLVWKQLFIRLTILFAIYPFVILGISNFCFDGRILVLIIGPVSGHFLHVSSNGYFAR